MLTLLLLFACTGTDDSGKDSPKDSPRDTAEDSRQDSQEDSIEDSREDSGEDSREDSEKESSGGDDSGDESQPDDSGEESSPPDSDPGDSGDSGRPDSGGDSAEDSGEDSGGSNCTTADLVWTAEVRDATGAAGTVFSPRQALTVVGVVSNPCGSDVSFVTPDACLVTGYSITDSRGMGMGVGVVCAAVITPWTVPAGGSIEDSEVWGRLTPESYVLDISFNYQNHTASQAFVVQ